MTPLGIFCRYPETGAVKTRLAATVGDRYAAEIYSAFVEDLIDRFSELDRPLLVAFTPGHDTARQWFVSRSRGRTEVREQPEGSLGDRMAWYFQHTFQLGHTKSLLIGSDSPDLPDAIPEQADRALDQNDVVLCPATDGGFTLIGLRREAWPTAEPVLKQIPWSSPSTLLETQRLLTEQQLSVGVLSPWYDVDTLENLGTFYALQQSLKLSAAKQPHCPTECPRSREVLERLSRNIFRTKRHTPAQGFSE